MKRAGMRKGEATREAIVEEALAQAVELGLEGISLGVLAESLELSKSGLFAHFKSKTGLQVAVLEAAIERFRLKVIAPALAQPKGRARLTALFERHLDWIQGDAEVKGCLFISAIQEYDSRESPVRDLLVRAQEDWRALIQRLVGDAVAAGQLRKGADAAQLAFEVIGLSLAFQVAIKLLGDRNARRKASRGLHRLLDEAAG